SARLRRRRIAPHRGGAARAHRTHRPVPPGRRAALLLLGALAACAPAARAAPAAPDRPAPATPPPAAPACLAETTLDPPRAVVGQQVLYRVRILRREGAAGLRWMQPLSFPSFRAEWLPGRSPDPRIAGIGAGRIVFEERRALFPARAGTLAIPPAAL